MVAADGVVNFRASQGGVMHRDPAGRERCVTERAHGPSLLRTIACDSMKSGSSAVHAARCSIET
jgi:hypothetical protein